MSDKNNQLPQLGAARHFILHIVVCILITWMLSTESSGQISRDNTDSVSQKNTAVPGSSRSNGSAYGIAKIEDKDFRPRSTPGFQEARSHPQRNLPKQLTPVEVFNRPKNVESKPLSIGNAPTEKQNDIPADQPQPENDSGNLNSELATQTAKDDTLETGSTEDAPRDTVWDFKQLTDRENLPSTIQMIISFASISLVPAILLMTTCFIRIVVVLGILRQAIGLQQLPPTQVTTALAILMTFLIMTPTWKQVKENAIDPYSAEGSEMTWEEAWHEGVTPVKKFMWRQIKAAENDDDFWLFYDYLPEDEKSSQPESFDEIPLKVMMPAFMISELKVAFLIGAQIFLPFLILDIVVASFSNTMGLIMLPPTVASLPLKLILFVMVDGWNLVVGVLLNSFAPVTQY